MRNRLLAGLLVAGWCFHAPAAWDQQTRIQLPAKPTGKMFWSAEQDDFTVRVRSPGGEWQDLYEYKVRVDSDTKSHATMVFFNIDGPVEVSVKKNNGMPRTVAVRPASRGVEAQLQGDTAVIRLDEPAKISVEFDDDRLHNLHLIAGALRDDQPEAGEGVRIFGPGDHEPEEGGYFHLRSGEMVYLAPGAILNGGVVIDRAENVRLIGNGLIYNSPSGGIRISYSRNVTIDGPTVVNPVHYSISCGQSQNITVTDFRAFSEGSWTDGIDLMACSDMRVDDVFLRNSDDTIAVYAGRNEYHGDSRNFSLTNAVLWADIAHPIHIGIHGSRGGSEVIDNLVFRDIDILEHDENDPVYQGALAINAGDGNLVSDVLFEDIRVERIEEGIPFLFRVVFNDTYSHAPGRGIRNVTLRNIRFPAAEGRPPVVGGYSADRTVRDVTLDSVTIGGRPISRDDIAVGDHVENLSID
jgi:hypothetical protein